MIHRVVYRCKYKLAPLLGLDRYWGFRFVLDRLVEDQYTRIEHEDAFKFMDPHMEELRQRLTKSNTPFSQPLVILGGPHTNVTAHLIAMLAHEHRWHMHMLAGTHFALSTDEFVIERLNAPSLLADFGNMTIPMPKERKIPVGQSPRQDPYDLCNCDSGKRYRKCCGRGRTW